ncbi:MAG: hypothetical protein RXS25_38055, partial [Paraburkholderia sp.]
GHKSGVSRSLQTLAANIAGRAAAAVPERARGESLLARMLGRQAAPKLEMHLDQQGKHHVAS